MAKKRGTRLNRVKSNNDNGSSVGSNTTASASTASASTASARAKRGRRLNRTLARSSFASPTSKSLRDTPSQPESECESSRGNIDSSESESEDESITPKQVRKKLKKGRRFRAFRNGRNVTASPDTDLPDEAPPLETRDDIDSSESESESESSEDENNRRVDTKGSSRSTSSRNRTGSIYRKGKKSPTFLRTKDLDSESDEAEAEAESGAAGTEGSSDSDDTTLNILVIEKKDQPAIIPDHVPSEEFILSYGLSKVGWPEKRQHRVNRDENIKRFKAHFGAPPRTVRAVFNGVKEDFPKAKLEYFLLALNWLKLYETEYVLNGRWERCNDFIRAKTKEYVRMIQSLKEKKIVFGGFDDDERYWLTVDTVNFRVQEFRLNPSTDYYDHKRNGCGLKWEFACALRRPAIVWARGPEPAGKVHDGTMFRGGRKGDKELDKDALYAKLPAGKKAIGDSGYEGMPEKVTVTRDGQSNELKQFLGRAKNRQESMHTRLKSFGVLGGIFRHGRSTKNKMELHKMCVEAVCVIVQYDLENGNPLMDL